MDIKEKLKHYKYAIKSEIEDLKYAPIGRTLYYSLANQTYVNFFECVLLVKTNNSIILQNLNKTLENELIEIRYSNISISGIVDDIKNPNLQYRISIPRRYISFSVYRITGSDGKVVNCTNNGVSGKHNTLYIEHPEGPCTIEHIDNPEQIMDYIEDQCMGNLRKRLIPRNLNESKKWTMFGGNYGHCSDSRVIEILGSQPVAIHDRVE